jgi:hypothetical protein
LRCVSTFGVSAKIGQPQLCRDIHSAVDPESVSDAIALTLRWKAVNSVAMAIDWSIA